MHSHLIFKVAAGIWTVFTLASLFLPFWPRLSERFYGLKFLPKWPWHFWVIGFLVLFCLALFEGGHTQVQSHKNAPKNDSEEFSENDPKIVPECRWADVKFEEQIYQDRPITLVNRGRTDAKDIRIGPIVTPHGRAEFQPVGYIPRDKLAQVLPEIPNASLLGIGDIVRLLDTEWQFPINSDPVRKSISIQYSASVGRDRFMTTGIIVRDPSRGKTEILNLHFRKIPQTAS